MHNAHVDRRVSTVAAGQHGLVTRQQCVEVGASNCFMETRRLTSRLVPVGKHVLRVAGAPETSHQRLLAAVLDAGPSAVATLHAAAALWDLPGYRLDPPQVLVPVGTNHRPWAGSVTETRLLLEHHVTGRAGIPVVTPARVIVELAGREHPRRVERTTESAIAASILTPTQLAATVSELARRGRRGSTFLRDLVAQLSPGYIPPASELEARFRDLLSAAGLPQPARQVDVGGDAWIGRVDLLYPEHRLVIELDSRRWHDSRSAMESDRERDNRLVAAGWRVIRITWRQLHDNPISVVALVRRLIHSNAAA